MRTSFLFFICEIVILLRDFERYQYPLGNLVINLVKLKQSKEKSCHTFLVLRYEHLLNIDGLTYSPTPDL